METFNSFTDFWRSMQQASKHGFDRWVIAHFTHTSDETYAEAVAHGTDTLGFQPLLLTLADPVAQQTKEVVIKNVTDSALSEIKQHYSDRFIRQLPRRFGLFAADKNQADAIYASWRDLEAEWFMRDGQSVLDLNLPLLFDHVSNTQYWAWQQKGYEPCDTQRLIITVFQYRTGRFADLFITDVDDNEMQRIAMLLQSKLSLNVSNLL